MSLGYRSVWLPEDQRHDTGQKALFRPLRGDLHRGAMWTDDDQKAGDLLLTSFQELAAGSYSALLQFWAHEEGVEVGTFVVEDERGRVLGEARAITGDTDFGDWQRVIVAFQLADSRPVRLRFAYNGAAPLWTGTLQLSRGGPRLVYVIGHNRNTPAQANKSLDNGANALEVDISYRQGRIMAAELAPFPGWTQISEIAEWLSCVQKRSQDWAFLYLDCKLRDVPEANFYRYGKDIVALLRTAGVPPERCLFSIPDQTGVAMYQGVRDSGYQGAAFCMDGIDDNQPIAANEDDWARVARDLELPVIGMGRINLEIEKPLERWWPILRATNNARDRGDPFPRKVIFWSLHEKGSIRKVLDLGVDGVIVDREDHAREVLAEPTYRQLVRRAQAHEWNPRA